MEGPRPFAFQNWKSDSTVLHSFFESVVANYKRYEGSKTLVQVYKSHALYKQATSGDCNTVVPSSGLKSKEGMKWSYWNSWRGTTKETAKRR
jgi:acyl-CoA-binding protein